MSRIRQARRKAGDLRPILFLIIDNTNCPKTPSSKKIERLESHHSHKDGKSVWAHCVVTSHVIAQGHFTEIGPAIPGKGSMNAIHIVIAVLLT
ncbi:hypothetical protein [Neobacillus terrae]|uniref:hypothetical protein n=1 Tax=Neobacillus terrae TaxID=3034837 RepID=UPI00140E93A9|nr:hypothetical protein [Neobacillus terrae]NHM33266.1 hypothetical protein [Neobacillus terrae]